jgi:hypothetical protein
MTYHVIGAGNSINNSTDNLPLAALHLSAGDNLLVQSNGFILATGLNSDAVYLDAAGTNVRRPRRRHLGMIVAPTASTVQPMSPQ